MSSSNQAFVYKAKERRRTIRVFKINRVVAIILLLAIVSCGAITFFAIKSNKEKGIDSKSFYFLEMGQFTSSGDALTKSMEIKNAGGAGYVINDGIFRIMATVFSARTDAELVRQKLIENGTTCSIYHVKTSKLRLEKYDSDAETNTIRSRLLFPTSRLFNELQAQDIAIDAGETSNSAALLAVSNLKKELTQGHEEILTLLAKHPADKMLNSIEKIYNETIKAFDDYLPQGELTIGTSLKSILCAIVEINLNAFK